MLSEEDWRQLTLKLLKIKKFLLIFLLKVKRFGCCEWGENDILRKHLKSASYPYNLVVGGLLTNPYLLFTGVCKCYYNNSKLYRNKWVHFLGLWTESPFSFSAVPAAVKGYRKEAAFFSAHYYCDYFSGADSTLSSFSLFSRRARAWSVSH